MFQGVTVWLDDPVVAGLGELFPGWEPWQAVATLVEIVKQDSRAREAIRAASRRCQDAHDREMALRALAGGPTYRCRDCGSGVEPVPQTRAPTSVLWCARCHGPRTFRRTEET